MFFNSEHILVTNPNTKTLEKKLKRIRLDVDYLNSLVDEDLLDAEEDEGEINDALVDLDAKEAILSAEFEVITAIKHYFFVKEAIKINDNFRHDEEFVEHVIWADGTAEADDLVTVDDVPEPDACDSVNECIFSAEDMQILTGTTEQDTQEKPRNKLYEHAERELLLRGDDKEFVDMFLSMITCFSSYGHSGSSAEHSTQTIERLLRWQNLTELTDDPGEWLLWTGRNLWQNQRNFHAFTYDHHFRSYWLNDDEDVNIKTKRVVDKPIPATPEGYTD